MPSLEGALPQTPAWEIYWVEELLGLLVHPLHAVNCPVLFLTNLFSSALLNQYIGWAREACGKMFSLVLNYLIDLESKRSPV